MENKHKNLKKMIEEGGNLFLPHLSVDIVIFGYEVDQLKVLLLEITHDKWMLPGGYIFKEEAMDDASKRVLWERTGLEEVYLKQFYTFGKPERSFSNEIKSLFKSHDLPWHKDLWINQRFISTGYYALVNAEATNPVAGMFARDIGWFSINDLPDLLLDHRLIIDKAFKELQKDLQVYPVAYHLLPKKFTMPELHRVFETVLQKKMDRSRFQKKMFEYGVFKRLDERREGVPYRRPYLYSYEQQ